MKVLLGMSGGLDSTYAAIKLKEMGYEVEGAVLKMHNYTEVEEAEKAALAVKIPLHVIDCREDFNTCVVDSFAEDYLSGKTPNPCIICNATVKFKKLYETAKMLGFDKIATGHYANIVKTDANYAIKRGSDAKKDQSYVLWRVDSEILSSLIFPLSEMEKSDIREKAREMSLSVADREESQEICFIPDNDYPSFIEKNYRKSEEGDFVSTDGRMLGRHKGILHYTVGQRRGLGVSAGERMFITKIDAKTNTITLAKKGEGMSDTFTVSNLVFTGMKKREEGSVRLLVKTRYLAPLANAEVTFSKDNATVRFLDEPRLVTPGQSAVFYLDDVVMFGGFID